MKLENCSRYPFWLVVVPAALLSALAAKAQGQQPSPACPPPEAVSRLLENAASLLDEGDPKECLAQLRPHRTCLLSNAQFVLLLSRCYEHAGNPPWAVKVLSDHLAQGAQGCEVRARLAWLLLKQADYRGALAVLGGNVCPRTAEERVRWHLLNAEAELQAERTDAARDQMLTAIGQEAMFAEDEPLFSRLYARLWPMRTTPLELRGDLENGWTSNPLLGSPLDPQASEEEFSTWKTDLDLTTRVAGPYWDFVRLLAEADLRSHFLYADSAREYSYVGWGMRPGLELSLPTLTLTLNYHYDSLWLAAPDQYGGKGIFYTGHRGELLLQTEGGFYVLGGGGHRSFRRMGRTRSEFDLGVGFGKPLWGKVFLMGGISGRGHRAKNVAYNLWGGTSLVMLRWGFYKNWSLRMGITVALDWYPDSAQSEDFHSFKARRDVLLKGRFGLWSPPFLKGVRAGLQYEPSRRFSTAKLFDFVDHTALVALSFGFGGETWRPKAKPVGPFDLIDYGLEGREEILEERLQDLLRSDEEAQRGSSCLE